MSADECLCVYLQIVNQISNYEQELKDVNTDLLESGIISENIQDAERVLQSTKDELSAQYRIIHELKAKIANMESSLINLKTRVRDIPLSKSHAAHIVYSAYKQYNTLIWMSLLDRDRELPALPDAITDDPYIQAIIRAKVSGDDEAIKQAEQSLQQAAQPWKAHVSPAGAPSNTLVAASDAPAPAAAVASETKEQPERKQQQQQTISVPDTPLQEPNVSTPPSVGTRIMVVDRSTQVIPPLQLDIQDYKHEKPVDVTISLGDKNKKHILKQSYKMLRVMPHTNGGGKGTRREGGV